MISRFVVFRCHGNIDFCKISIIKDISVYTQLVVKILRRFDEGKSTKKSFKNLSYGPQKTVSNHLKRIK